LRCKCGDGILPELAVQKLLEEKLLKEKGISKAGRPLFGLGL